MTETFRKLNFKAQNPVLVLGAPAEFEPELAALAMETDVHRHPLPGTTYGFVLAFGAMRAELLAAVDAALPVLAPEERRPVLWFCYPKTSSKRYVSDVNRDSFWTLMEPFGLKPNRQVAVDQDWSALRFRRA